MDFKTFYLGLVTAFLSMFVSICFGQADNINEYRKIESIDNRLEELKRSLQNMQREAGYKKTEKELIKSAPPSANSSQRIINTNKFNLPAIEKPPPAPPVERITEKERESFDSTKKSADALIKKISDRISSIEEITESKSSNEQDLNVSRKITAEPSLSGLDLPDKVPQPSKDVSNIPPVKTEVTKSSAQRAYEQLEERRREVLSRRLEEKASAPSTDNTEVKNKTGLPIRVSSIRPIFQTKERPKTYAERKFPISGRTEEPKKEDNKKVEKIEENLGKQNSFNFYYGFSVPNLSEYDVGTLKFKNGHEFSMEYLRDFGLLSLGAGYSYKAFENERWSMTGSSTTVVETQGNNTFHSFTVSAGIEPHVNDLLFLRARFAGGFSLRNHELIQYNIPREFSETSFHYAFMTGLGLRWSDYFHSILYYKFDGATGTPNFGHASFHQFGIGFGLDF